jgi:hypothetical protein
MRHSFFTFTPLAVITLFICCNCHAQDSTAAPTFTSPYDSITIIGIQAVGHSATGIVEITLHLRNNYHGTAQLGFGSGIYSDFGLVDDQGGRYRLFHSERLESSGQTNQGYSAISSLQFGKNKLGMVNRVQDTLSTGAERALILTLGKGKPRPRLIQEAHLLSTLQLNYLLQGQKQFHLKNIPIKWIPQQAGTSEP